VKKYRIAILVVVIIVLAVIVFRNKRDYKSQINASNDSIQVLNDVILRQDKIIAGSRRKDVEDSLRVVSIQDSTGTIIKRLKRRNYEYLEEINSRDTIPLDDRYIEFKEWLRTIQF
jgi:hypothetical protein